MKIGLCFAGGGARGAYQVGVAAALEELGILARIGAFSGTSIGAVNAAFVATKPIKHILSLWNQANPEDIKKTESWYDRIRREKLRLADNGLFEIRQLQLILNQELDLRAIKKREIYVTLSEGGTVDSGLFGLLKETYRHYIKHDSKVVYSLLSEQNDEDIANLILASCSIPVVFAPVRFGQKQYYDGGVYDNLPVEPLVQCGCDKIIVVHLHLLESVDKDKYGVDRIFEIRHKGSLGGILHFDPEHTQKTFELGYRDLMERSTELLHFLNN
ncbi:MAG: patatin-like phospholipase family protein [Bacillus subtilis]|nr:patatin-like phospholipase family protein [Bacillus subtilis]